MWNQSLSRAPLEMIHGQPERPDDPRSVFALTV